MRKFVPGILLACILVLFVACGGRSEKVSDAEIQATVQAALFATQTAQANFDNAVNAAVNATAQSNAPTPTAKAIVVTATPQPGPTIIYIQTTPLPPTATPVNTTTLSQEQLVALINQAVAEAYAASQTTYATTTASTQDNTVTAAETQSMTYYVQVSAQQVDEALALIEQYYAQYGSVSQETLALLQAIETDLNSIADNTASMAQSLQDINATLASGVALAQETITQLNAAASNAQNTAQQAQAQAQAWSKNVKTELETRAQNAASVQANVIANNPLEAAGQLQTYLETARGILQQGTFSTKDIQLLAQQGANTKASLQKFGGANGEPLATAIDRTTQEIARGDLPQARGTYNNLERSAKTFEFNGAGGNNPRPNPKPRP